MGGVLGQSGGLEGRGGGGRGGGGGLERRRENLTKRGRWRRGEEQALE